MIKKKLKNVIEIKLKDKEGDLNKANIEFILIPFGINGKVYSARVVKEDSTYCYYVPVYVLNYYKTESLIMKIETYSEIVYTVQELDCSISKKGDIRIVLNDIHTNIPTILLEENKIKGILSDKGIITRNCSSNDVYDILTYNHHVLHETIKATVIIIDFDNGTISLEKILVTKESIKKKDSNKQITGEEIPTITRVLNIIQLNNKDLFYPAMHTVLNCETLRDKVVRNKRGNDYVSNPSASKVSTLVYNDLLNNFVH